MVFAYIFAAALQLCGGIILLENSFWTARKLMGRTKQNQFSDSLSQQPADNIDTTADMNKMYLNLIALAYLTLGFALRVLGSFGAMGMEWRISALFESLIIAYFLSEITRWVCKNVVEAIQNRRTCE